MKKMTGHVSKGMLMCALICGTLVNNAVPAFAGEMDNDSLSEFMLDPMIVTAQRVDTKDLHTPASVEVYNKERIEKTGAANAYDVLQNTLGVMTQSQGFNGTSMGTMTSKVMIRGVEKGTLVMVNGVPMNLDGKYNLDDIPTESIERIEVVRGGGSVLYGSEATGGVINIITKKKFENSVGVAAGNFGKERYKISLGNEKFNIIAGLENRGRAEKMSGVSTTGKKSVYDYGKGERKSLLWNLNIIDGLSFTHSYSKNRNQYEIRTEGKAKINQYNKYKDTDNNFMLNYEKEGWKASLAYGTQEKGYDQGKSLDHMNIYSWRKGHSTNANVQKQFDLGRNRLLLGTSFQREDIDLYSSEKKGKKGKPGTPPLDSTYKRDVYSLYASYEMALGDKSNLFLNARETWATNITGRQTDKKTNKTTVTDNDMMRKFTPEVEYLYKFDENSSFYAKAGKSFRLPHLTQIYGNGVINPTLDLKPEQGTHYEMGYKLNRGNAAWRVSVFNYKIKDAIDADVQYDEDGSVSAVNYYNEDNRDTGVEVSVNLKHNDNWSSNWGAMLHNPQARNIHTYGDNNWHDMYNRYQFNGGVNYKMAKFAGSLTGNFVGNRTSTRASFKNPQRHIKPQFFTDLHLTYAPEANQKVWLHLNNLLDRLDVTSNSTSNYYSLGRNFMLGYEYTF